MTEDAVGAFRATAICKEPAKTVVVIFALVTIFTPPCQIGLAQLSKFWNNRFAKWRGSASTYTLVLALTRLTVCRVGPLAILATLAFSNSFLVVGVVVLTGTGAFVFALASVAPVGAHLWFHIFTVAFACALASFL